MDKNKREFTIEIASAKRYLAELKYEIQKKLNVNMDDKKLIFNGQQLDDDELTLEEYRIKDDSRITYIGVINNDNDVKKSEKIEEKKNSVLIQKSNSINLGYNIEQIQDDKSGSENNFNSSSSSELLLKTKNKSENYLDRINEEIEDFFLPKELKKIAIFMKILTLKDPKKMEIILENLKLNNQPLLNKIKENKENFIKYLEKPIVQEDIDEYKKNYKEAREYLRNKNDGKIEILLNEKESQIINNLIEIGKCSLEEAIEAYIVNDKDEKKAENYLLNKKKE
jgi:hypothetical protein